MMLSTASEMKTVKGRIGVHYSYINGVYTAEGDLIPGTEDEQTRLTGDTPVYFQPDESGRYYVGVRAGKGSANWLKGAFILKVHPRR